MQYRAMGSQVQCMGSKVEWEIGLSVSVVQQTVHYTMQWEVLCNGNPGAMSSQVRWSVRCSGKHCAMGNKVQWEVLYNGKYGVFVSVVQWTEWGIMQYGAIGSEEQ